jgi:outer membrane protein assembly factor BamB
MTGVANTALLVAAVLSTAASASRSAPVLGGQDAESGVLRPGSDWPRFLGPAGDGTSPETGILTAWGDAGPPLVWEHVAGEGYSAPVVAGPRLFFFDRVDGQARLTCLDAATGAQLWRTEYPSVYDDYYGYSRGPRASPVVDDGRVFTFGVEGVLRAYDVEDGRVIWEIDTVERFGVIQNFFGVGSAPVVEGELLIVVIGGSPAGSPRIHSCAVQGNGTGIVAFDKATGEVRYTASDELAGYATPTLSTIAGRRWAFAFVRGGLLGFDPATGAVDFRFPWKARALESVNASNPVVVGDTVLITEAYGVGSALLRVEPGGYEVLRQDGRRDQSMAAHFGNVIYHEGTLYGSHGRNSSSAELRAVDYLTGEVRWRARGLEWTTLLHVDGHLVALSADGRLHLVEVTPEAYRPKASITPARADGTPLLGFPSWSPPVLSRGLLYLRGRDRLVALELIPAPP